MAWTVFQSALIPSGWASGTANLRRSHGIRTKSALFGLTQGSRVLHHEAKPVVRLLPVPFHPALKLQEFLAPGNIGAVRHSGDGAFATNLISSK
jgi:hypothetical protein